MVSPSPGLPTSLYYVRAGVLNTYALGVPVKVPHNVTDLHFTWTTTQPQPVSFFIIFSFCSRNISDYSEIPKRPLP